MFTSRPLQKLWNLLTTWAYDVHQPSPAPSRCWFTVTPRYRWGQIGTASTDSAEGGRALLGADDSEVASDLRKVKFGKKLSPVLLIQGTPLWIADGYHRVCASYHLDEKIEIPCRIVPRSD